MERTPRNTPNKGTPRKTTTPLKKTMKEIPVQNDFSSVDVQQSARIFRLTKGEIPNFKGLKNYPNMRIIDLRNNSVEFSVRSILVAFRSMFISEINGTKITVEDYEDSFRYSGIVTCALRAGFDPNLSDDPEEALNEAIAFLFPEAIPQEDEEEPWTIVDNDYTKVEITREADLYSWTILDGNYVWKTLDTNEKQIMATRNSPLKCVVKGVYPQTVIIPEYDRSFHVHAELIGEAAEGGIISVKAPLSSHITWRHVDDEEVISEGSLVLPLSANDVNRVVACDITPAPGLPTTRLTTQPVKAGEFRFKSLRMAGTMIEDDEIEFDISTRGTKATFKGVRILRSARHGEWEQVTTLEGEDLKYRLTVHDIGCVIRAVCLTEGGGPPLMITSSERVQPSAPVFFDQTISGTGVVGTPLFAVASYKGGIQGNCRYEWNVGPKDDRNRPVVIPQPEDVGRPISCRMIPVRSDGSIGRPVVAEFVSVKPMEANGAPMRERFIAPAKKGSGGRIKMAFADERPKSLYTVHEGETLVVDDEVDWAIVASDMIHDMGHSSAFTAPPDFVKGFVVLFTDDFFILVGQIEPADPAASNVQIRFEPNTCLLSASYDYTGGIEGRTVVQWNRRTKYTDKAVGFGRNYHASLEDNGATFTAVVTPVSIDGKRGKPASSEPFTLGANAVIDECASVLSLTAPETVNENQNVTIIVPGAPVPEGCSAVRASMALAKAWRVVWTANGSNLAEGLVFKPTYEDIGTVVTVHVVDRVRNEVVAECELPPVEAVQPTVDSVTLSVTVDDVNGEKIATVTCLVKGFDRAVCEKQEVQWLSRRNEEEQWSEITIGNDVRIQLVAAEFDGWEIAAYYTPISRGGVAGNSILTEPARINFSKPPPPDITAASISVDDEYRTFTCNVTTDGSPGTLQYLWGYLVDGEEQYLDVDTPSREITEDDFSYPPFCCVQPIGESGELGEKALVFLPMSTEDLFKPKIENVRIAVKGDLKEGKATVGSELSADVMYSGPPATETAVVWQRSTGKSEWETICEEPFYIPTGNDAGRRIRAKVAVKTTAPILEQELATDDFNSEPIAVVQNPVITKLATALRRARAQFDARISLGDEVTVAFEQDGLIMRARGAKGRVLLRSPYADVTVAIRDGEEPLLELSARKGYNTELVFAAKKMESSTKLSPLLARELFVETLRLFKKERK